MRTNGDNPWDTFPNQGNWFSFIPGTAIRFRYVSRLSESHLNIYVQKLELTVHMIAIRSSRNISQAFIFESFPLYYTLDSEMGIHLFLCRLDQSVSVKQK